MVSNLTPIVSKQKSGTNPDTPSLAYDQMAPDWALYNVLMGGTRAMREAAKTYTPQLPVESDANYKIRLAKTDLFNQFKDAVYGVASRPFSKPMSLKFDAGGDDVDSDEIARQDVLKKWSKDVDLEGNDLHAFWRKTLRTASKSGIVWVFTDYPRNDTGEVLSMQEEYDQGYRPYHVRIEAENMLEVRDKMDRGRKRPVYARWLDYETIQSGPFGQKQITIVNEVRAGEAVRNESGEYVWQPASWTKWQKIEGDGEWVPETNSVHIKDFLPLEMLVIGEKEGDVVVAYFRDLAYKNVVHWNSSSDQRNILTHTRFPQRKVTGMEAPVKQNSDGTDLIDVNGIPQLVELPAGPDMVVYIPDPEGDVGYFQAPMGGVESGSKDLENLEKQMHAMSLAPLAGKAGVTATGEIKSEVRINSLLLEWTLATKSCAEQSFAHMCDWYDLRNDGFSVFINTNFGITKEEMDRLQRFATDVMSGTMTKRAYIRERMAILPHHDDFDIDTEISELSEMEIGF